MRKRKAQPGSHRLKNYVQQTILIDPMVLESIRAYSRQQEGLSMQQVMRDLIHSGLDTIGAIRHPPPCPVCRQKGSHVLGCEYR